MSDLILFWHRRDLRISDNIGLAKARQMTPKVIGVFCLDLNILERDDIAPARVTYMIGCLQELQRSYQQASSQLLILKGQPQQAIPQLAASLKAKAVVWNWDVEPYSQQRDTQVKEALQEKGIQTHQFWDQILHNPDEIKTKSSNSPYTVYTPFWKQWIQLPKAEPAAKLEKAESLSETEQEQAKNAGVIDLPTAKDLGFIWQNELLLEPGEQAALEKLKEFCSKAIYDYGEQRNYPAIDGTSKLSAALKFGAVSIRTVWQAVTEASHQSRSDETDKNIQTWQHELAWREFYQHAMYHFPSLAEGPYRETFQDFPWENNE
ncbi:MAG: deoxyribodipyrimidine photolyase, partial [Desertifilum sp. SIO1I2]|nr:deoxyribodipyrimidine photolyase [Desertifilum sp. SIO1I2]